MDNGLSNEQIAFSNEYSNLTIKVDSCLSQEICVLSSQHEGEAMYGMHGT
jgi:hypothetical protein